jgi:hypothetical protein
VKLIVNGSEVDVRRVSVRWEQDEVGSLFHPELVVKFVHPEVSDYSLNEIILAFDVSDVGGDRQLLKKLTED